MTFVLPFGLVYLLFTIWPVIQGAYVSFHKWNLMGDQGSVGMANYVKLWNDKFFWQALGHTAWFSLITVPVLMVVAVSLALLADRKTVFRRFLRSSYYLPSVLSVSVASFIASYMAAPYLGFVNNLLHDLGILRAGQEIQWLMDKNLVWVLLSLTTIWWTIGFSMLLYLAALQEIPDEIMEAADIDGASKFKQLFQITLPLLSRTHYLVILLQVIACFKVFGQIQLITNGGPGTATKSLVMYIYEAGFKKNNLGYASAMSFALFLILLILSLIQVRLQSRSDSE